MFDSKKLQEIFNSERLLKREYGEQAQRIKTRIHVLLTAKNLAKVPIQKPDRRHELKGDRKGCFAVDLKHPFRLVFKSANDPVPLKEDGGFDLEKITAICILTVEDYH